MASDDKDQEDRTEEPTQRKLEEAAKRGDIAKSVELNTFFVLAGFLVALMVTGGYAARETSFSMRAFLMNAHQVPSGGLSMQWTVGKGFANVMLASAGLLGIVMAAALAGCLIQHRPLWTFEPMTPKISKLSLMQGAKRVFGKEALANFIKGMLKIVIVGVVVSLVLWAEHDRIEAFARMDVAAILPATFVILLKMLGGVVAIYFFVGIGDFVWQRFSWMRRQRMTREELKQEYKDTDGNPEIKAKLRQLRTQRLKRRMMAEVPKATVVITNPTHYAVALRYEPGMDAPVCVAKGLDAVALKIREVAGVHDVPIIENPPLARALHATVDLEEPVPVEHYKAVAEVIGFVLRRRVRRA
jgi:flagellar biosynthesis protein FlhB